MKLQHRNVVLGINDTHVTSNPVIYTCYGLGSCIGLFVTDRVKGLSGGAHIPLPKPLGNADFLGAKKLIDELLASLEYQGSDLSSLRAKVTGGAQIYESTESVGSQNEEAVMKELVERKIFVAAKDVGGKVSRTARFYSDTGEVLISTSEQKKYRI
ncbi:MAG: chemotaxis protein CheD [Bacteroidetes bacterium]|nr:chemotaxis protein CheD [Bacteroidota bacterium]